MFGCLGWFSILCPTDNENRMLVSWLNQEQLPAKLQRLIDLRFRAVVLTVLNYPYRANVLQLLDFEFFRVHGHKLEPLTQAVNKILFTVFKNGMSINKVELATNGMKEELLAATRTASHAEGMAAQRLEDKDASAQTQ
jgi:hypothetical protein